MRRSNNQAGFSLLEVLIAMGITITIMGLATTLLAASFRVRSREDRKSDAVADVQRALNIMTREIANAGLKLPERTCRLSRKMASSLTTATTSRCASSRTSTACLIRPTVISKIPTLKIPTRISKFLMYVDATIGQRYIVRYERNGTQPNDRAREPHRFTDLSLLRRESYLRHDRRGPSRRQICDITNVRMPPEQRRAKSRQVKRSSS